MRYFFKLVLALFVFVMVAALWLIGGHEYSTLKRLERSHAVADINHCKLLYSTGYLKENIHIFECRPQDILSTGKGGLVYIQINPEQSMEWQDRVKVLFDAHIKPAINWKKAVIRSADGKGILSRGFLVHYEGCCYISLETF